MKPHEYHKLAYEFLKLHNWQPYDQNHKTILIHPCFPTGEEVPDGEAAIRLCMDLYSQAWECYIALQESVEIMKSDD